MTAHLNGGTGDPPGGRVDPNRRPWSVGPENSVHELLEGGWSPVETKTLYC